MFECGLQSRVAYIKFNTISCGLQSSYTAAHNRLPEKANENVANE